ncbi:MAG TPA: quinone-dependent dihydroorotate dehydrogenase [Chthoniobacterales bacterium]|jgi:dihydroorotate dehydrogenase
MSRRLTIDCYRRFVRPVLFQLDPESAHHLVMCSFHLAPWIPGALTLLHSFAPPPRPRSLFGLQFRNPIGLAAGFDKNAVAIPAWEAMGFGFVEIGTVTAQPQSGNPRPRIFRYPSQEVLINRLGFNNEGARVVAERLRRLRGSRFAPSIPIGINLGKSRTVPLNEAASDYRESFRQLAPLSDYVALNISSPNTPQLRALQEKQALEHLLHVITEENARLSSSRPLLIKIAPDLSDESLLEIAQVCETFGLAGVIATNTTIDHAKLTGKDETGGLSGTLLRARSTAVVRLMRSRTHLPIIAVGGISDSVSAHEKFEAGAQLLQIYSGFIFRGPNLLRNVATAC